MVDVWLEPGPGKSGSNGPELTQYFVNLVPRPLPVSCKLTSLASQTFTGKNRWPGDEASTLFQACKIIR